MKIAIVGSGFVGQATGQGLQQHGHIVTYLDTDPSRIKALANQGLDAQLAGDYHAITTDLTMISVPTLTAHGTCQLDHIKAATIALAARLKTHADYHMVVVRSTVPPGTTRTLILSLLEQLSGKQAGRDFGLVMQPEFLREATAADDYAHPRVILIGEHDEKSGAIVEDLYRDFKAPIYHCTLEEAEFQKYVHNCFNAAKIAFFNEMRMIAEHEGWDTELLFRVTTLSCESLWNPMYGLRDAGPFDGACLPKDTEALLAWSTAHGYDPGVLRAVIQENAKYAKTWRKHPHSSVETQNDAILVDRTSHLGD